ncbi:MAG: PAS domain S-box protein [Candidatus Sumerlaeia bacterium]
MTKKSLYTSSIRIILPALITLVLFAVSVFFVFVPSVEKQILRRKKETSAELVHTAVSMISEYESRVHSGELSLEGAKERAAERLRNMRYGPQGKDYFWVVSMDENPMLLVHPYIPRLENLPLSEYTQGEQKSAVEKAYETIKNSEDNKASFAYRWQWKDDPTQIKEKVSYVQLFEPWDWIIGTGLYMEDVKEEIAEIKKRLWIIFIVILIIVTILTAYLILQAFNYERAQERVTHALAESEERYRKIFDSAGDTILVIKDGYLVDCNRKALEMFNCPRSRLIGRSPLDLSPEVQANGQKTKDLSKEYMKKAYQGEEVFFEWRHRRDDGSLFDAEVALVPADFNEEHYAMAIVRDVTERKRTQVEMQRLVRAIEDAAEEVVITDLEGTIEYVNPAFERITGYSRTEAIGQNPRILKSGKHDAAFYQDMWKTIQSGQVWTGRLINKRKDGSLITEEATISPILSSKGLGLGYVSVKRDISNHLQMENQLRQAQKMEAIGQLAGGIAHDFNNILSGVLGFAEIILDKIENDEEVDKYSVNQILHAANRARELVQQILTFSRRQDVEMRPVSLGKIAREALKLLRASIPATIRIEQDILAKNDIVLADPTQMHQVVVNLCTNAYHAMRESGGILSVKLEQVEIKRDTIARFKNLKPGQYLRLVVSDTGCGIPPENLERIFEPFFTTKARDEGTGMGLSVVHGIITRHGGDIVVQSEPDEGASFEIFIPRQTVDVKEIAPQDEEIPGGDESVLLVDDEATLTEVVGMVLESLGYHVDSTNDPREALQAFQKNADKYDLVITDLTMPNLTGSDLAMHIHNIRQDIPIIMLTGYGETTLSTPIPQNIIDLVIHKPVTRAKLAQHVREVLDSNS